jgi:hypothetical protein
LAETDMPFQAPLTYNLAPPPAPTPAPPPGLVNSATQGGSSDVTQWNPAAATAAKAETSGYTPEAYTVGSKQTVAGQIKDIIDQGSPLLEQAQAQARAQMNARGLINSTTAVTAGNRALYDVAMPIASADAATYDRAATNTTTAQNTALGFKAAADNTAGLQDAQLGTQTSQFNASSTNTALSQAAGESNKMWSDRLMAQQRESLQRLVGSQQLAAIDATGKIQTQLTDMSNKNKLLLQTSQNASQYYTTMLQYMGSIMSDPNLDAGQKQQALNNSVTTLNDALDTMTSIADIPGVQSTLNFGELRVPDAVPYEAPPSQGGGLFG